MVNRLPPSSPDSEDALVAETERLLGQGEPLLAYNTASTGLQRWPEHLRLRQLQALSLARSGDIERANRLLTELAQQGLDDAETLGVLARTHKDLGLRAQDARHPHQRARGVRDVVSRAAVPAGDGLDEAAPLVGALRAHVEHQVLGAVEEVATC